MATWAQVQQNPTLYPKALSSEEGAKIRWHPGANRCHSSQVFCVSAFGALRCLPVRDKVIPELLGLPPATPGKTPEWIIELEVESPHLLSEFGPGQASSIDALLLTDAAVFCVEAKFLSDAAEGFGGCSQPKQPKQQCAGHFGPGSDLKTGTNAWCRLEVWDGDRSPRTYWTLGRAFFQETVYARQESGETCPFCGPNYQLMRNFLFAAAFAQEKKLPSFGVLAIVPEKTSDKLTKQIDAFRTNILQPQFRSCVKLITYEHLIALLQQSTNVEAATLATFLLEKIAAMIL